MNPMEFLEELNDVDDDLILSAQTVPRKKHHIRRLGLRAGAVAAILCLLTVTAAALTISVGILTSQDEVPNYEQYYGGIFTMNSKVTTIEYDLRPQEVRIPMEWTGALTDAWKAFAYDYDYFTGIDLKDDSGSRINYGGLRETAQLLDLPLTSGNALEEIAQRSFITLAVTDRERAASQMRTEGTVSPDGIVIYLPLELDAEGIDYCGLSIFVPVTESFAEGYASHTVMSSVWNQDLQQSRITSVGGIEIVLLQNAASESDPLSFFAAWERDGIGYLAELKTIYGAEVSPGELLIPYLEELEG